MVGIFLACPRNSVYTVSTCGSKWQKVERRFSGVPAINPQVELMFLGEYRHSMDGSGRILVPQFLRERHGLNGEVVMVGAGSHFELWSPADWAKQSEKLDKVQNTADYFAKLNLFMNQSG